MGRKKKAQSGTNDKRYFTEVEEAAIVKYNQTEDYIDKNIIFTNEIYKPLKKLVHEICKKYQTGTGKFGMADMETMAFSHTWQQIPKFNPNKPNKLGELPKAYSYLGTVCRHYVTNFGKQSYREKLVNDNIEDYKIDYDEIDKSRKDRYILETFEQSNNNDIDIHESILNAIVVEIKNHIDIRTDLTINEIKVGDAIVMIFENWKNICESNDIEKLSNFFAKKKIHQLIKDITNLETKEIKPAFEMYSQIYKLKCVEIMREINDIDDFKL